VPANSPGVTDLIIRELKLRSLAGIEVPCAGIALKPLATAPPQRAPHSPEPATGARRPARCVERTL
jgi:hypothetical protein